MLEGRELVNVVGVVGQREEMQALRDNRVPVSRASPLKIGFVFLLGWSPTV